MNDTSHPFTTEELQQLTTAVCLLVETMPKNSPARKPYTKLAKKLVAIQPK